MAKNKGGRPTKYDPKYCDEIIEFFDVEHTKIMPVTITYKNGDTREEEKEVVNALPTFQQFAFCIGVHTDTLQEWKKVHPEFSVAYKMSQELQEAMWLSNSMKGLYPGSFTIFAGKNMFGWRDKKEVDVSVGAQKSLIDAIIEAKKGRG
jgi:hypothetical protein